jgi:hypothetical protein
MVIPEGSKANRFNLEMSVKMQSRSNRATLEPLEGRRLFCSATSAAVLDPVGSDSSSPTSALSVSASSAAPLAATTYPIIFSTIPNVVGEYTGTYSITGAITVSGSVDLNLNTQLGKQISGDFTITALGQTYQGTFTGKVNLHGLFKVDASTTDGQFQYHTSGHLNALNTRVRHATTSFDIPGVGTIYPVVKLNKIT